MTPVDAALLWLKVRPIRRIKELRQRAKETKMLQGKLTYTAAGSAGIIFAGQALGLDITETEAASIVGAVLAAVAIFGRWRATKGV